jgi:hypothetical protein
MLYLNYQFQAEAYAQLSLIYMVNDKMENRHDFLK